VIWGSEKVLCARKKKVIGGSAPHESDLGEDQSEEDWEEEESLG
jgi:hypothetical protein